MDKLATFHFSSQEGKQTKKQVAGLPWWSSGKETACSARDTGSIPGPGRGHMPAGQLNSRAATTEPGFWSWYSATRDSRTPRDQHAATRQ